MLTDAHCHPFDLARRFPQSEEKRRRLGVLAAASACDLEEFAHNEELARKTAVERAAPLLPCFAVHPQQIAESKEQLAMLDMLAAERRLAAVGECGFDLFNAELRETEAEQDRVFTAHLKIALKYELPVVLHVRRAMHKVFAAVKTLSRCRAVVFHSWPGTLEEGNTLLRRGVNVYFSFGNAIMNGHKRSMQCCALFPPERLLTETDAPYQARRGETFSQWSDLPLIIEATAVLRREASSAVTNVKELETQIENNFNAVFKS